MDMLQVILLIINKKMLADGIIDNQTKNKIDMEIKKIKNLEIKKD